MSVGRVAIPATRVLFVHTRDDLRQIIETGLFWETWSVVSISMRQMVGQQPTFAAVRVVTSGWYSGRMDNEVLEEMDCQRHSPEAALLLAMPSSRAPNAPAPPSRTVKFEPHPAPARRESVTAPLPAAAPSSSLAEDLKTVVREAVDAAVSQRMAPAEARIEEIGRQATEYVQGLRADQAASNLGTAEQLRTLGRYLPTNHAVPQAHGGGGLVPSVGRQMAVTRSSANYRNDPRPPDFRQPEPRQDTVRRTANMARGPGFGLQYTQFEPTPWEDLDEEHRTNTLATLPAGRTIANKEDYESRGRQAPCALCNGNHHLVQCPGNWACTDACRAKVGALAAEAMRLRYDAKRAADNSRRILAMTCSSDDALYQEADSLEYVPIQRLTPTFDSEVVQRVCALCECLVSDDMGLMLDRLDSQMHQSWLNEQSAKIRGQQDGARRQ